MQAFERLLNGGLDALHTLVCLEPTGSVDPVAICIGSEIGLGAMAAILQASRQPLSPNPSRMALTITITITITLAI